MSRQMDRIAREAAATYGPAPATPIDALAHVLCAFADLPDDHMVMEVTRGIYGEGVVTGLTLGDLRALQQQLDQAEPGDECPVCGAPADATGTSIPEHRPGSPCTVDYRPV